jgi:cytochrome b pre-mRNA-processing protein 3
MAAPVIDKASLSPHVAANLHCQAGSCQRWRPEQSLRRSAFVLAFLFRRRERRRAAHSAFERIVERARDPYFYTVLGVPDTLDGRFELLTLHAFLVLNRLRDDHAKTGSFAQALFDAMFADFDRALREMGVADLGVGRRVKAMARGFYGRVAAYGRGLADPAALAPALRRNLYGTTMPRDEHVAAAANYLRRQAAALGEQSAAALIAGAVRFAPMETP